MPLGSLEVLKLELSADQEDKQKEDVNIPPELFVKNLALKELLISIDHTPERRVYLSEDAFAENTNLAVIQLDGGDSRTHKRMFAHLTKLSGMSIARRDNDYRPELEISEKSPLYKRAATGRDTWTSGYRIAGIED